MNHKYDETGGAARLRERAAALRAASSKGSAPPAPAASPGPAPPVKLVTTPKAVREAIGYAKWLALPASKRHQSVPLGTMGKQLYEQTLADMHREAGGAVLLDEARSVLKRLDGMPGGRVVWLAPIRKFMNGGKRIVAGIASTSDLDRQGDIVVPSGMKVQLPISLLWQHDHSQPIGSIYVAKVKPEGVWIECELVSGVPRADEAWKLVDGQAINSFSIGFRGLKSEPLPGGGLRFTSWELYEVSLVSVPANPNAKIRR